MTLLMELENSKRATKNPVFIPKGCYRKLNKIVRELGGRLEKRNKENERLEGDSTRIYARHYNYVLYFGNKKNADGTPVDMGPFWNAYRKLEEERSR